MKPSMVSQNTAPHICIFGDPKTGKSTLAAELLKHGFRLTWVSMDNGHEVLFKFGIPLAQLEEQLEIVILPDTKEFPVAIKTCRKIVSGKPVTICDKHGEVDCSTCRRVDSSTWTTIDTSKFTSKDILVFDHLGQLANSAMTVVFKKGKKDLDDDKAEWDDYARQGFLMDGFLTNVQQAPYNIICITHVCESEMEDGKKKLVPLSGTTNFSRNTAKYFGHVIHCSMVNKEHKFGSSTGYINNVITGSRSDKKIELDVTNPSLKIFFDGTVKPAGNPPLVGSSAARSVLVSKEVTKNVDKLSEEVPPEPTQTVVVQELVDGGTDVPHTGGILSPVSTLVGPVEFVKPTPASVPTTKSREEMLAALKRGR